MSPRLLVLSLAAICALGCNARTAGSAQATPPADVAPAPAPATPEIAVAPEVEPSPTSESAPDAPAAAPADAESTAATAESEPESAPASDAAPAPARYASTQPTTAPAFEPAQPVVVVPTTTAAERPAPKTAADYFDAQLAALINNEPPGDLGAAPGLADDDRALLRSVIDSLTSFRMTLRGGNALRQTKVAPLLDLGEKIRAEIPLSLPTLELCRSVQQFGVYDPFDPPRFTAGRETPVVIYCEVDHFRSVPVPEGGWETKLSYEAVLYSDSEAAVPVITKKPTQIVDRCRNRRRDFFLADRMTLPANLPVGKYVLKVTVIDQLANLVAEKTAPVLVGP